MRGVIARADQIEALVADRFGVKLEGLRILDIGAGQRLLQMKYFSQKNEVVGIDRDVVIQGLDLRGYLHMFRTNGLKRAVKTAGRKVLRIDSSQSRELGRMLGVERFPTLEVHQMDAAKLRFADDSFEFVYSLAVLPHLEQPENAIAEIARVLASGGIANVDFILYTSRTGSHDIRLLGGRAAELPIWAHLRPQHETLVQPSAYLNKLRLGDWKRLFSELMPGSEVATETAEEWVETEARRLKEEGDLADYSLEELITTKVVVLWQKPASAEAVV